MAHKFCKYQDPETSKTFVIVDKNKQPLTCHINNKCKVGNCKKLIDNPSAYTKTVDRNVSGLAENCCMCDTRRARARTGQWTGSPFVCW